GAGEGGQIGRGEARGRRGGARCRGLSRCAGGPAHLGGRHGRGIRYRGAPALDRLGLWRGARRLKAPSLVTRSQGSGPMPKVLIADELSPGALEIFRERGVEADVRIGLKPDQLKAIVADYDGLAVRSATKATRAVIEAARRLKVIGRAGIGVDNIDLAA